MYSFSKKLYSKKGNKICVSKLNVFSTVPVPCRI